MTRQRHSKVAPRRSWHYMTELMLHSRSLHNALAIMEHHDKIALLISEMPRVRSPKRRVMAIQEAPQAAPAVKPLAKSLVFRKTKRELEREQQACKQLQNNRWRAEEAKHPECAKDVAVLAGEARRTACAIKTPSAVLKSRAARIKSKLKQVNMIAPNRVPSMSGNSVITMNLRQSAEFFSWS